MVYRARAGELDGRKIWDVGSGMFAMKQSVSHVKVAADDFRPIRSRWMHELLGDVTASYGDNQVSLQTVGKPEPKVVPLDGRVFDNEECLHLMRRLPLALEEIHRRGFALATCGRITRRATRTQRVDARAQDAMPVVGASRDRGELHDLRVRKLQRASLAEEHLDPGNARSGASAARHRRLGAKHRSCAQ
jgi:hypothetical protein